MSTQNATQSEIVAWLEQLPGSVAQPQSSAIEQSISPSNLASSVGNALDNPVHFPSLTESVFPGDRIALVVQTTVPQPKELVKAVLEKLLAANVEPIDIRVVITPQLTTAFGIEFVSASDNPFTNTDDARTSANGSTGGSNDATDGDSTINSESPTANQIQIQSIDIVGDGFQPIEFEVHDPNFEPSCACIAVSDAAEPIHINRTLADADVVIPIGCSWPDHESRATEDCVYPDYSTAATIQRYQTEQGSLDTREKEIVDTNNNLGVFFGVQVTPSPGGNLYAIRFGTRTDIVVETMRLAKEAWTVSPSDKTLAIATLESDRSIQTWVDFRDAVIRAAAVSSGGPIVVLSNLQQNPDRNIRKSCQAQFSDSGLNKLSNEYKALASIICEVPVFLSSNLSRAKVEELGLGYLKSADDLLNLVEKHPAAVLLRDANRVVVG